ALRGLLLYLYPVAGLRVGHRDHDVWQTIASEIIELAKTGERNPDLLCKRALKEIRQCRPASLQIRSPPGAHSRRHARSCRDVRLRLGRGLERPHHPAACSQAVTILNRPDFLRDDRPRGAPARWRARFCAPAP